MSWVRTAGYLSLVLIRGSILFGQGSAPPELLPTTASHLILQPGPGEKQDRHWSWTNRLYPSEIEFTVKDAEDRPIPGAAVEFRLPDGRSGAVFHPAGSACVIDGEMNKPTSSDKDKVACVKTDVDGIARIYGLRAKVAGNVPILRATKVAGNVPIGVKAMFGHETAETSINMKNQAPPFIVRHKVWIIGATCAAVAITVVMLRRNSPPTATIGSVTATGPVGP
jgi:hypothetical protein